MASKWKNIFFEVAMRKGLIFISGLLVVSTAFAAATVVKSGYRLYKSNVMDKSFYPKTFEECEAEIQRRVSSSTRTSGTESYKCYRTWTVTYKPNPPPPTIPTNSVQLTWTQELKATDGSELKTLKGFRIYYGELDKFTETLTINDPSARQWRINNFRPGTFCFKVSSFSTNSSGDTESEAVASEPKCKVMK